MTEDQWNSNLQVLSDEYDKCKRDSEELALVRATLRLNFGDCVGSRHICGMSIPDKTKQLCCSWTF